MRAGTATVTDTAMSLVNEGPFRININVSAEDGESHIRNAIRAALEAYTDAMHPRMNTAVPEEDEYGTPYRYLNTPEQFDTNQPRNDLMSSNVQPMTLLAMRMGWGGFASNVEFGSDTRPPFNHVSIHRSDKRTFVFVVHNEEAITLEDETSMFPSDSLVTRLRMLSDKKE